MKRGITFGVFDVFHIGHLNMLKKAKEYCDYLIVAVHDDRLNIKSVEFLYSLEDRIKMVSAIRFVDEVIRYERVDLSLPTVDFDVLLCGPDQNHQYFQNAFRYCKKNEKDIQLLARTEGISSTKIREIVNSKNV